MQKQLEEKTAQLIHLSLAAQNKKILPEECVVISNQAFQLENEILTLIDAAEEKETDIKTVRLLYDLRENVWDIVGKITAREEEIKAKSLNKDTYRENKEAFQAETEHGCCHHHGECHCGEIQETTHISHCAKTDETAHTCHCQSKNRKCSTAIGTKKK